MITVLVLLLLVCAFGWLRSSLLLSLKKPRGKLYGNTSLANALYDAQELPWPSLPTVTIPESHTTRHGSVIAVKGVAVLLVAVNEAANTTAETFSKMLTRENDETLFDAYEALSIVARLTGDMRSDIIELALESRPTLAKMFSERLPQWNTLVQIAQKPKKPQQPSIVIPPTTPITQ